MDVSSTPLEEIRQTADKVAGLLTNLFKLRRLNHGEGIDFRLLEIALESWVKLLSDSEVQAFYAREQSENRELGSGHLFPSAVLSKVRAHVSVIHHGLSEGDVRDVTKAMDTLFEVFGTLTYGLKKETDIAFSPGANEAIARFEVMDRIKEADNLRRRAEDLVASTQESASKASEAATSASEAAGIAGESIMASYFKDFAEEEWRSATKYRVWTIRLLAIGGGLAAIFLLLPAFGVEALALEAGDYVHLAQRIIVTAAVFALAAYLARQSHQHRTLANWAKTLSVQLKTFDAFMAPLDSNDAKEALRAQFAARVFGEPPVLRGDASPDDSSPVHEKMFDILSRNIGKPQ